MICDRNPSGLHSLCSVIMQVVGSLVFLMATYLALPTGNSTVSQPDFDLPPPAQSARISRSYSAYGYRRPFLQRDIMDMPSSPHRFFGENPWHSRPINSWDHPSHLLSPFHFGKSPSSYLFLLFRLLERLRTGRVSPSTAMDTSLSRIEVSNSSFRS